MPYWTNCYCILYWSLENSYNCSYCYSRSYRLNGHNDAFLFGERWHEWGMSLDGHHFAVERNHFLWVYCFCFFSFIVKLMSNNRYPNKGYQQCVWVYCMYVCLHNIIYLRLLFSVCRLPVGLSVCLEGSPDNKKKKWMPAAYKHTTPIYKWPNSSRSAENIQQ